jgi:hypothetical protein
MRAADTEYGRCKSEADLRKLAKRITELRNPNRPDGPMPYDGPNGMRAAGIVPTATVAREVVRRYGKFADAKTPGKPGKAVLGIGRSYDREAYGMLGKREDPKVPAKRAPKAKAKRTRKATPKAPK